MRTPETITLAEHKKIVEALEKKHAKELAARDGMITELATVVDEYNVLYSDFTADYAAILPRGKKIVNSKGVERIAFPPKKMLAKKKVQL